MKRTLLFTILIAATLIGTALITRAWAAGDFTFNLGDFTIALDANLPDDPYSLAEKRLYYLTSNPIPLERQDPNDPNSPMVPTMTDRDWFISKCRADVYRYMLLEINRGKSQLEARAKINKVFKDK